MTAVWLLAALAVLQGIYSLVDGLAAARNRRRRPPAEPQSAFPRVHLFCPCKGIDAEFDRNIRSILKQDHPSFQLTFVVESESDPAFEHLIRLGVRDVVVAGLAMRSGQKVHNLLAAVKQLDPGAEILAFCDADAEFSPGWLRALCGPLTEPGHAAATGYRWYLPVPPTLPVLWRSAWNGTVLSLLGDHSRNFLWGGSMAVRRDLWDRHQWVLAWDGALSDDFALTTAVQRAGCRIVFVPEAVVPSRGACSFRELIEFTTRQVRITRVYRPVLWWAGLISQTVFNGAFISLTGVILLSGSRVALFALMAIMSLAGAKSWLRWSAVSRTIDGAGSHGWFYVLSPPLVAILQQYNFIASALTRNIVWRGIRYTLISTSETLVRRTD